MVKILVFGDLDQPNGVNYYNSEQDVRVYLVNNQLMQVLTRRHNMIWRPGERLEASTKAGGGMLEI